MRLVLYSLVVPLHKNHLLDFIVRVSCFKTIDFNLILLNIGKPTEGAKLFVLMNMKFTT